MRVEHGDMLMARFGAAPCTAGYLAALPERVVRELDVPVLFLRAGTCLMLRGLKRVLVPLDGSAYAEAILPLARELLPAQSGSIHLLVVIAAHGASRALRPRRPRLASRAAAEAYLDRVAARPELAGTRVERTILEGVDPAQAIESVAHEARANLVALMTRDRGLLGRTLLGSITHRLLADPHVPLLLWRSPVRARTAGRPAAQ